MSPERRKQIEEVLEAALEHAPAERGSFLSRACAADDELRHEVELRLSYGQTASMADSPAWAAISAETRDDPYSTQTDLPTSLVGQRIGTYQIERELGRGGMGAVYLATRADNEFQRRVAIKLIKRGMDTDFILRRFRRERQILAGLNHHNIAALLDGGSTPDGLPYFVMEYIDGRPIHHYCNEKRLTVTERLRLVRQVCTAVGHAHEKQIVHRDIKPGNILVTAEGVVKLLDFGIAKLLAPVAASDTLDPTATTMRMMTPEYASPEQVRGLPVMPASDVYSLGVMLYELLTGHRPYYLNTRATHELVRIICEGEPERASIVISRTEQVPSSGGATLTLTPEAVSAERGTTPEALRAELAGNLDNIIFRAMQKEPERRYASAAELAADIDLHLKGGQIFAHPHTVTAVTTRKIEHDAATAQSVAVLPFRVVQAGAGEDTGETYLGVGVTDALITQLSNIRSIVVRPTSSVIRYSDVEVDPFTAGRELGVDHILDGRIQLAGERLRVTVQLVSIDRRATLWAEQFDEKYTDILGVQDAITARVAESLLSKLTGEEQQRLNQRETVNADAWQAYLKGRYYWNKFTDEGFARALEHFREAIRLDPDYALAYVGVADYYNWAAIYSVYSPGECYPQAKAAASRALEIDDSLAEAHAALAFSILCYDKDWDGAERRFRHALELNPNYTAALQWQSNLLLARGHFDEAIAEIRRAQELNPLSLVDHSMAGWTYYQARQYDRAIEELRRVINIEPGFGQAYIILTLALIQIGKKEEAVAAARQALPLMEGSVLPIWVLARARAAAGRHDEAREIIARLQQLAAGRYVSPYYFALMHAALGERDWAIAYLERADEQHDGWLVWLGTEPALDALRDDPRFNDLLRRVGLGGAGESAVKLTDGAASRTEDHQGGQMTSVARGDGEVGRRKVNWPIAVVIVALLAGAFFGLSRMISQRAVSPPFLTTKTVRITTTGNAVTAAISPDGRYVAYAIEEAGRQSLWARPVAIASSARIVEPSGFEYRGLAFSRDGANVYYVAAEKNGRSALFQVPALGGSARMLKEGVDGPVGLSPDGKQLAFVRHHPEQGEDDLLVINEDGTGEREIATRKFPEHLSTASAPAWSPDGRTIACVVETSDANGFFMKATQVRLADGSEKQLSSQRWMVISQMAWLADGRGIVMSAQDASSPFPQLWSLPAEGPARKLTSDLSDYKGLSLTADSGAIVTIQRQTLTNIWVAPKVSLDRVTQITSGAGRYFDLAWTPDGRVLYASDASDSADIWERQTGGAEQRQLTAGAGRNYAPTASPDGRSIVFHSNRSGNWQVWRMDRDGGNQTQLTRGSEESNWPQVSPDGRWVVYEHVGAGTPTTLWKMPFDGGEPVRLTDGLSMRPAISPDGKLVACWHKDETPNAPWRIELIPFEGGPQVKVFDLPRGEAGGGANLHWTPDGRAVIYSDFRDGVTSLWQQPTGGGEAKKLIESANEIIYSFALARDGRLALSRGLRANDVVLITDTTGSR